MDCHIKPYLLPARNNWSTFLSYLHLKYPTRPTVLPIHRCRSVQVPTCNSSCTSACWFIGISCEMWTSHIHINLWLTSVHWLSPLVSWAQSECEQRKRDVWRFLLRMARLRKNMHYFSFSLQSACSSLCPHILFSGSSVLY